MSELPKFAVVGHPNKGKSSIVATLSQDERVSVGRDPGTTEKNAVFSLKLDGRVLFELIDTPGFQRPRKVLKWMKQHEQGAASHPEIVKKFVSDSSVSSEFPEEVELLKPITQGAGILYVVDGSTPYGPEYEAELEILRWSGQPRMALINPIGPADFIEDWTKALEQFFSVVRVFNALEVEFEKQLELLRAFGQLNQDWRESLGSAVAALQEDRDHKIKESASIIARLLSESLSIKIDEKLEVPEKCEAQIKRLQEKLEYKLVHCEERARSSVERLYRYERLDRAEDSIRELSEIDLFSQESWKLFGLSKKDLLTFSAVGGAAVGGGLDVLVGGSSLMMGSLVGGLLGAGASLFGAEKLVDSKVLLLPLGERVAQVGPVRNLSFPHMLLERARLHHQLLGERTHANRHVFELREASLPAIPDSLKRKLESKFRKIRKSGSSIEVEEALSELVKRVLDTSH